MFEPGDKPRVFGLPPGVDFPKALIDGLAERSDASRPEDLARVNLVVNTRRMARRIREIFDAGPPRLLPRISLLTSLQTPPGQAPLPPPVPPLRRRLELAQLVGRMLDREPDLAARESIFGLADSLAELLDEMQGEGISPDVIQTLDVSDMSGHWARTKQFLGIVDDYVTAQGDMELDGQARQRLLVRSLIGSWKTAPPKTPLILAGSTGSRGTTAMLMAAVSRLPQGAIVLPGFDFDQPLPVWDGMDNALHCEDHPQFRFKKLTQILGIEPGDIAPWTGATPPSPGRNRLISLALRPAPVTDAWLTEGPLLRDIDIATSDVTILQAPDPRTEALAIALRLRQAAETGQIAALITPDRMLTRRVSAALDRWDILPDDSAGLPLQLSPPGRFLRHVAELFTKPLTVEMLLALLKHPLCHDGPERGNHLRHTRDLELHLRRHGPPFPTAAALKDIRLQLKDAPPQDWVDWLGRVLCAQDGATTLDLSDWTRRLRSTAEALAAGAGGTGCGTLWDRNAGQKALAVLSDLESEAAHGGAMTPREFSDLLGSLLSGEEVRDRDAPHDRIMIWGTLEARVQGADLVILGGLNEGSWPESTAPDPWLNRTMRARAGLLLPERRVGLSAHDFQQAASAPEVWLTRSRRSEDAETVPARWLNRVLNLLQGLPDQNGPKAVQDMQARGQTWLDWAAELDAAPRIAPALRPSPRPPVAARPRRLSVTEIKRLIRDPYAIYAKHVLRLHPLNPLVKVPDALVRGNAVHELFEDFIRNSLIHPEQLNREAFMDMARDVLERVVPWPAARRLWLARLDRIADAFLAGEIRRRATAVPIAFEAGMNARLLPLDFTLTGRADRIDQDRSGALRIYDYKTGNPPSAPEQARFDKQLLIEAAIAEQGGFMDLDPAPVAEAVFLGVGGSVKEVPAPLQGEPAAKVLADLISLIGAYLEPDQGFTARRMLQRDSDNGDYDHLARFGEWDNSAEPVPEDLE
ncbi:double-strand break repair protein AddB [Sedimentitalea sp. JM2-8]|uniref:Double-strand break repair protein AddB n=1 Tax=Sedimentitalea xiamensis TaxID=3050037 RepID=A0ABT7F9N1_9RHOB|nr:double-strand break repair protein AddB [Sedimentitalea xiamensis]MDK3071796.1 double-strand break repair protein AddB [Sedimentitalea xiamensis]